MTELLDSMALNYWTVFSPAMQIQLLPLLISKEIDCFHSQ